MNNVEFYEKNGYVILENLISEDLIDSYEQKWIKENGDKVQGWDGHTSYLDHPEILDILCHKGVGDFFTNAQKGVALHLNLTYWVSTEKGWHMDSNIPNKMGSDNYTGAWVALEDISLDSGPFQLIPGSHLWDIDLVKMTSLLDDGKAYQNCSWGKSKKQLPPGIKNRCRKGAKNLSSFRFPPKRLPRNNSLCMRTPSCNWPLSASSEMAGCSDHSTIACSQRSISFNRSGRMSLRSMVSSTANRLLKKPCCRESSLKSACWRSCERPASRRK